jgi:acid phosphatase type 7
LSFVQIAKFSLTIAFGAVSALAQPDMRIADDVLSPTPIMIAYGDTRFTDPQEINATNPKVRRWLVDRIASERPDTILISGDLPWNGNVVNDYVVYHAETAAWRAAGILISPALGNHEFHGDVQLCLDNWWNEFPKLRGRRWYSIALGSKLFVLNLDSNSSLLPDSEQTAWIKAQLAGMAPSVQFVFINLHHPPVADVQAKPDDDHNPRPNEAALADLLRAALKSKNVRFIVCAGHIHNYERFLQDGVVYLVSGGGGAKPRPVVRELSDLYRDEDFPNYHYVKFVLRNNHLDVEMIRVADPTSDAPGWQLKDRFQIPAP